MIVNGILLAASMAAFLMLGIVLGFMSVDLAYRRALMNLGHFARRMIGKAFVRTWSASHVCLLEQIDREYSRLGAAEKLRKADPCALQALQVFYTRLQQVFGAQELSLYFFGSRLRGSFTDWSDLDVVIFFDPAVPLLEARRRVWREVFHILLQHGLLIQPRLATGPAADTVAAASHPMIRRAIETGILIA